VELTGEIPKRVEGGLLMRVRLLISSLFALLALTLVALPAAGQPASSAGTATVSFTNTGCSVTVTYEWSGFGGRDLRAEYGVVWPAGGGSEWWLFEVVPGATGSGTASHEFVLAGRGTQTFHGGGRLVNAKGKLLSGSAVSSPTSADLSC
jgi:hypothetical protein